MMNWPVPIYKGYSMIIYVSEDICNRFKKIAPSAWDKGYN